MRSDKRDPQLVGEMLAQLKILFPDKSAAERADLLESGLFIPHNVNGSK